MNSVKTRVAELTIESPELIRIKLLDGSEIEKDDAQEVLEAIHKITEKKPYYLLTETAEHFTASNAARQHMADNIYKTSIAANAICLSSLTIRLFINSYIHFNRPKVPTRVFNSEAEAIKWMKSFPLKQIKT